MNYDLVVIGSGPAGEKAAAKAAYFGQNVALIEKENVFGGACIQTGTIPSKTLKESALYFSGVYEKGIYGLDYKFSHKATVDDFMFRKDIVIDVLGNEVQNNLIRHKVEIIHGVAEFISPQQVKVTSKKNSSILIEAKYFLIATGSYPFHPEHIPFDGERVHDSNTILTIKKLPSSILIVGAGVIACEYATIYAAMGIKVLLVNNKSTLLNFADKEISEALRVEMENLEVTFLNNSNVEQVEVPLNNSLPLAIILSNGQQVEAEMFLFAAGRNGNTKALKLENAGLDSGKRELLQINENFQTRVSHIYAVGDVIGFPALASTSMDQGRLAIGHMFKTGDLDNVSNIFPFGIYTIPEISMVGITEEQAIKAKIDYCTGRSYYNKIARARIQTNNNTGFMKLIFDKKTKVILGVHIIGQLATEIIHYGLTLVKDKRTVHDIISTVFNYPTLHNLYKYAAYDGLGNQVGHKVK